MTWRNAPSRRAIRNALEFMGGGTNMEAPTAPRQATQTTAPRQTKRGPQAEGKINDAIIKAGRIFGAILYRNRRGMLPLPNGGMLPFGLGPAGFPDEIGYTAIRITPEMVGRTVAVFTAIEAKTETGKVASHQRTVIDELRERGCIAGVATCGEDVRTIIREWEGK